MKKRRNLSVFTLISMVMLFLLIMPVFASGTDTCTVSSDGTQTCVASGPTAGFGAGSSPGSPGTGTIDPVIVINEPTTGIPVEKPNPTTDVPVEVKPGQTIPAGEVKPADAAPDAVVPGSVISPAPTDEKPAVAEDLIGKDDGIRYLTSGHTNTQAPTASDFTGSTTGWISGLTVIASFLGAVVYAMRSKKNKK
jgi:hypothetical protein